MKQVHRMADLRVNGRAITFDELKIGDRVDALWPSTRCRYPAVVIGPRKYFLVAHKCFEFNFLMHCAPTSFSHKINILMS